MERQPKSYPVFDGHVDVLYEIMTSSGGAKFDELREGPVTGEKLEAGDIRVFAAALYCPDEHNGPNSALKFLEDLLTQATTRMNGLVHIKTNKDVDACFVDNDQPGFLLLLENADALLEFSLERLRECALKVIGLTHMGRNRIGDGNGVSHPEHLSRSGRALVGRLAEEGFAIDVAHLSVPCFWDVIGIFHGPKISSHTGFRFFCDKPRNLDEDQLRILFEEEGMVGVAADPEMLSIYNTAGIQDVFKHIDWVVQKYGPNYVGLGSDFCGFGRINEGLEDISKLQDLKHLLHNHGYPEEAVAMILGGNWHRFYRTLLGAE